MKIDLIPFDSWISTNKKVSELLGISYYEGIKAFAGTGRAVLEITQAIAQFYSHKRSIAIISDSSPYLQNVLQYFYRETYEVQMAPSQQKPEEMLAWIDGLKKDTCFVISVMDHPLTGEIYPLEAVDRALESKRFIHLKLSHHAHLKNPVSGTNDVGPYTVLLRAFGPNTSVAIHGDKVKFVPASGSISHWNTDRFLFEVRAIKDSFIENESLVKSLESNLPTGFKAYFNNSHAHRTWDRGVFYSEEIGGEMLLQFLATKFEHKLQAPGFEYEMETSHLCRWGGTVGNLSWWKDRPKDSIVRGLMFIGLRMLQKPEFEKALQEANQECRIFSAAKK